MGKSKIKKSSSTNTFYTIINNPLIDFLKSFPKKENTPHTHLSMCHPKGSFYIPDDRLGDFYKIYAMVAFEQKIPVHMVEMNKEYGPIKIDLDFRYFNNKAERIYSNSHIEEFLMEYIAICEEYLDIDDDDERICIITERGEARFATSSNGEIKKNVDGVPCIKDGVHIMFPEIHTHYSLQMKFRELILKKCNEIFGDLNLSNNYSDVISCDNGLYGKFFNLLLSKGIMLPPSQFETMFVSTAHNYKDLDYTIDKCIESALAIGKNN